MLVSETSGTGGRVFVAAGMIGTRSLLASALILGVATLAAGPAGATPYYGFSGYYGGPSTYYTNDPDIHQTTRLEGGTPTFGVRTYTAGGPFWRYRNAQPARVHRVQRQRYRHVRAIQVRG